MRSFIVPPQKRDVVLIGRERLHPVPARVPQLCFRSVVWPLVCRWAGLTWTLLGHRLTIRDLRLAPRHPLGVMPVRRHDQSRQAMTT